MPRTNERSRIEGRIRALTLRLLDTRSTADRHKVLEERGELFDRLDAVPAFG